MLAQHEAKLAAASAANQAAMQRAEADEQEAAEVKRKAHGVVRIVQSRTQDAEQDHAHAVEAIIMFQTAQAVTDAMPSELQKN